MTAKRKPKDSRIGEKVRVTLDGEIVAYDPKGACVKVPFPDAPSWDAMEKGQTVWVRDVDMKPGRTIEIVSWCKECAVEDIERLAKNPVSCTVVIRLPPRMECASDHTPLADG